MFSAENNSLGVQPVKMKTDSTKGMTAVKEPLHRTSFFYLLIAPPGAGKTTLLYNLLTRKDMYGRKFDICHYFSPSLATIHVPLPPERLHAELDMTEIQKIVKDIPEGERCLFVFDDMVALLPTGKALKPFINLAYNRRHLGGSGGGVSIMMVSQKLTGIPRALRCAANGLFYWSTSNMKEIKCCFDEVSNMSWDDWLNLLKFAWSEPHSFLFMRLDRNDAHKDGRYFKNFDRIKML